MVLVCIKLCRIARVVLNGHLSHHNINICIISGQYGQKHLFGVPLFLWRGHFGWRLSQQEIKQTKVFSQMVNYLGKCNQPFQYCIYGQQELPTLRNIKGRRCIKCSKQYIFHNVHEWIRVWKAIKSISELVPSRQVVITDDANTLSPGHTKIDRQAALVSVNQFVFCNLLRWFCSIVACF